MTNKKNIMYIDWMRASEYLCDIRLNRASVCEFKNTFRTISSDSPTVFVSCALL